MSDQLSSVEYLWLAHFLGEHWQAFIAFLDEGRVGDGEDPEDIADSLVYKLEELSQ